MKNLELVKNFKRFKEYTKPEQENVYYAHEVCHYIKKNELCEDRGFEFYADIIAYNERKVKISEEKYHELKEQLSKTNQVMTKSNVREHYDSDYYYKVSKEVVTIQITIQSIVQKYYENKKPLPVPFFKKLKQIKEQLEKDMVNFVEVNKAVFREEILNETVSLLQYDLNTVENYIVFFEELSNDKEVKKLQNKIKRFEKDYKQLLKERFKYSEAYFKQLGLELLASYKLEDDIDLEQVYKEQLAALSLKKEIKEFSIEYNQILKEKNKYSKDYFDFLTQNLLNKYNLQANDVNLKQIKN